MSKLLQLSQATDADRNPTSTDAICALSDAELDKVTGGGRIWLLIDGEPVRLVVRPQ